jgi:hypothetical protein
MFGTIRRHQQWLWVIIIAVIIVSFVIFFSPNVGLTGRQAGSGDFGYIDGKPIPRDEYLQGYRESQLRFLISYGEMPRPEDATRLGFDLDREARTRVFLLRLVRENRIEANEEAAAQWVANAFRDRRQRVFRLDSFEAFLKNKVYPSGFSSRDVERFTKHEVAIQQLVAIYGLGGKLVPPRDGELLFRREHEQLSAALVFFQASNYLAKVVVNPTNLTQFYNSRLSVYQLPDRAQVSYVKFEVTNYYAEADQQIAKETNLTQQIDAAYRQQGPEYFTDTNGVVMAESTAKAKLLEQVRSSYALRIAHRKAAEFSAAVAEQTGPVKPESLDQMAAQQKLTVQMSEPFGESEPPAGLQVTEAFTRAAFGLTNEDPISPPVAAEDGFYVMALKKRIPKEVPSLESIRQKVTEDYRLQQATTLAREAGNSFHQQLTNGLAQGKTLQAIRSEAKVNSMDLPVFSLNTPALPELQGRADLSLIKNIAADLEPQKASMFLASRDGGFILYLKSRAPVDDTKVRTELTEYLAELRQERLYQGFNEWISRQISLAGVAGPPQASRTNANQ